MQPTHCTSDMPWAAERLGRQRVAEGGYVWRKLLSSGAVIASGSDFPVETADPLHGFYAAVTRQAPGGRPPGGWSPDQRMTRAEALRAMTRDAAYAAHAEEDLGAIAPGRLADFVVLSRDIMTVPPAEVLETRVLRTIVGGQTTYVADPLTANRR
jgi:predicted amidohydrolase YtcJ